MWLFLLFVHLLGLSGFNLIVRKSLLNKMDRFTVATVMQTGLAVPAVFLIIFKTPDVAQYQTNDYINFLIIVVLTIGLQVTNVKALQYLEAGVFPILYNLRILITTVLGILFLNEDTAWTRILGGVLILLAIVIVRQKGGRTVRLKGVEWGIMAAFVISFLNMFEKIMINSVGLFNYFPLTMIVCSVLMWAFLLARCTKLEKGLLIQPRMIQLMSLRAVSGYAFTGALAAGALVSVANYISGLSVIVIVVAGALLLGERDYLWRKAAAVAVAVIGLTIVLFSHLL